MEGEKPDVVDKMDKSSITQEEKLKELSKLFDNKVNIKDFISEVEKSPAIWDTTCEGYSDKTEKLNSWNRILFTFIPDFEGKSVAEKNLLVTILQKKWKGIRACYTRELLKMKEQKTGTGYTKRKQYVYFEQLRFLETISKKTATSMDAGSYEIAVTSIEDNSEKCDNVNASGHPFRQPKMKRRKRLRNGNDELIAVLKQRISSEAEKKNDEADEDRLFLLSLLSEIRKVPSERKLKMRADIISVVAAAQAPIQQQWPSYGGPFVSYPSHHPSQFFSSGFQQIPPHQQPRNLSQASPSMTAASSPLASPAPSDGSFSNTSDYVSFP